MTVAGVTIEFANTRTAPDEFLVALHTLEVGDSHRTPDQVREAERWPEAKKILTGNAYSNDAILGINNELGFEETLAWTVWQVPVADVRGYVSGA